MNELDLPPTAAYDIGGFPEDGDLVLLDASDPENPQTVAPVSRDGDSVRLALTTENKTIRMVRLKILLILLPPAQK